MVKSITFLMKPNAKDRNFFIRFNFTTKSLIKELDKILFNNGTQASERICKQC